MTSIEFVGGDEVRQPFKVTIAKLDGTIEVADLSTSMVRVVTAPVPIHLTEENGGVEILSALPPAGSPHGIFVLKEEHTILLPIGRGVTARVIVTDLNGVTTSSVAVDLGRLG